MFHDLVLALFPLEESALKAYATRSSLYLIPTLLILALFTTSFTPLFTSFFTLFTGLQTQPVMPQ